MSLASSAVFPSKTLTANELLPLGTLFFKWIRKGTGHSALASSCGASSLSLCNTRRTHLLSQRETQVTKEVVCARPGRAAGAAVLLRLGSTVFPDGPHRYLARPLHRRVYSTTLATCSTNAGVCPLTSSCLYTHLK